VAAGRETQRYKSTTAAEDGGEIRRINAGRERKRVYVSVKGALCGGGKAVISHMPFLCFSFSSCLFFFFFGCPLDFKFFSLIKFEINLFKDIY
jgi:hypothetical protein